MIDFITFLLRGIFEFLPMLLGYFLIIVGLRMKKSAGSTADQSAFWWNFFGFVWSWAEQSKHIVEKLPFFKKDLTENLGIRSDDGRIT